MCLTIEFQKYIKECLQAIDYLALYNEILFDLTTDTQFLMYLIKLIIYHIEIVKYNNHQVDIAIMSASLENVKNHYDTLLCVDLLYIIAKCENISKKVKNGSLDELHIYS